MPSTHSAVVFFYAGAVVLTSTALPIHSSLPDHPHMRAWPPVVASTSAIVVALSRVWRGHHDFLQIAAGSLYGAVCSVIAYELWINGLDVYGHSLERWLDVLMGWR
jgi:dolichyldiphosphatase